MLRHNVQIYSLFLFVLFIIDDEETINAEDPIEIDPRTGEKYNVITVDRNDFDIFEALDMDKKSFKNSMKSLEKCGQDEDGDFNDGYGQEIPSKNTLKTCGKNNRHHGTALLPPHV